MEGTGVGGKITALEMDPLEPMHQWSDRSSVVKVLGWLEDTQLLHNGSWTAFTELLSMCDTKMLIRPMYKNVPRHASFPGYRPDTGVVSN